MPALETDGEDTRSIGAVAASLHPAPVPPGASAAARICQTRSVPTVNRVLDPRPVETLDQYRAAGGGGGLDAARRLGADAAIDEVLASGLRGRGGAGFPTGRKWRTVADNCSPLEPSTVVVNAAEGEPGSFKDRMMLQRNPYRVLEGALVAALAVGADQVIVGMERRFVAEAGRVEAAIDEIRAAGWAPDVRIEVFRGPNEYLLGEETAMLESIDGRYPFPRITPPYRRGVDEVVEHAGDLDSDSASAAHVELAGPDAETVAPPTLVDNVETLANCALILAEGADWFRELGTPDSPGTFVCTVTGATQRHGVAEMPMGTPLAEVIEAVGGGVRDGCTLKAVMQGDASSLVPASKLDTPVSWEGMESIGSGLGAAAFMVLDDETDVAAVAAGASRFLAVESCGQCVPCKRQGLAVADALERLCRSQAEEHELDTIADQLVSIADGARCSLATQHQVVVGSFLELFRDELRAHVDGDAPGEPPAPFAVIVSLDEGRAVLDDTQARKQPDWTFEEPWSGRYPADRLDDHRAHELL